MLADFFARSIRLESFEIGDSTFSLDSLQETLRTLPPTIQELRIHNLPGGWQELDDSVLEVLATSGLCLTLRNLTIERGSKISDDAILQFVTARMLEFGTPVLQRVEIHFDRKVILDVVPSLQPFFDTGLIVSLDYSPPAPKGLSPWDGLEDNPDSSVWARRPRNYW
ncbi:hypothetical protein MSAN_00584500 [Mycena sanguinolenta]|uniref:Uncharacterized protein n=1 Tax=Mycena sanguinolenta TaxID=230812 RepID=A0A8H7DFP5_9AGAR|nr:hypothetical protein MSAN_00584500 [Mycena sanguinolenta]